MFTRHHFSLISDRGDATQRRSAKVESFSVMGGTGFRGLGVRGTDNHYSRTASNLSGVNELNLAKLAFADLCSG